MAKGMYHYIKQAWKKPTHEMRKSLIAWRRGNSIERVEKPLRLDRARELGYKAKPGFVVVRVRLKKGGRKRPTRKAGRRPKKQFIRKILGMSYQWVAEQRAAKKYSNLEVLNSYWVGEDGIYYFYEVIMIDPQHPQIKNNPDLRWIKNVKARAFRGLTSAARKSRGFRFRGKRKFRVKSKSRFRKAKKS